MQQREAQKVDVSLSLGMESENSFCRKFYLNRVLKITNIITGQHCVCVGGMVERVGID